MIWALFNRVALPTRPDDSAKISSILYARRSNSQSERKLGSFRENIRAPGFTNEKADFPALGVGLDECERWDLVP